MELHIINAPFTSQRVKGCHVSGLPLAHRPSPIAPRPLTFAVTTRLRSSEVIVAVLLISLATNLGCDRADARRNRTWGKVSYDGQAIEKGFIDFEPIEGNRGPQSSGVITHSRYDIPKKQGPFGGLHRVEVTAYHFTGRQVRNMGGDLIDYDDNFIPEKFFGMDSVLTVEIDPGGKNEHNFSLEK